MAEGMDYTEFLAGGESIGGGMVMNSIVRAQVASYWQVYVTVEDVDKSHKKASSSAGTRCWRRRTSRAADSQSSATRRVPRSAS